MNRFRARFSDEFSNVAVEQIDQQNLTNILHLDGRD